jgi:hypothetical protein
MIRAICCGPSAGPLTTTVAAVSNLSVGWGFIVSFSCWAHLNASTSFRARARGPVSGQLSGTTGWRGRPFVPVSCRLSATGIRLSVILFPPRDQALLTVGFPTHTGWTSTGLPRSVRTSCDRGGCRLYPEDDGAHPGLGSCPAGACRFSATHPYTPAPASHLAEAPLDEASTRVQAIHPSRSSSRPPPPGWNERRLGLSPELRTPPTRSRTTHVEGGNRPSSTNLEQRSKSST